MTKYCPYYRTSEKAGKKQIILGSEECAAWQRPLCLDCKYAGPGVTVPVKSRPAADQAPSPPAELKPAAARPVDVQAALKADLVGQAIKKLRLATGLKRRQFAERVGVSLSRIINWENGNSRPSPGDIIIIEGLFDIDLTTRFAGQFSKISRSAPAGPGLKADDDCSDSTPHRGNAPPSLQGCSGVSAGLGLYRPITLKSTDVEQPDPRPDQTGPQDNSQQLDQTLDILRSIADSLGLLVQGLVVLMKTRKETGHETDPSQ